MFEESLYEQNAASEPAPIVQEGGLFQNYELKTWAPSPRLYKILGASALANVLVLLVFGQTSLLTAKGCDSPLVGSVCQVLDTIYLGSMLLGTPREYADAAYERTELGDTEITYVELPSESSKLKYPEGYFELANPEQVVANQMTPGMDVPFPTNIPTYPGIPMTRPMSGNSLLNTPPMYAKPKKNVVTGDLPTGFGDNPTVSDTKPGLNKRKPGANTPTNLSNKKPGEITPGIPDTNTNTGPNGQTAAQGEKKDETEEDKFGVFINKRPMKDRAKESLDKIESHAVKIDAPFKVTISAKLATGKDGKTVVLTNTKVVPNNPPYKNDPLTEKFVQDWILAVGDAGWFGYLTRLEPKPKNVIITVEQNDTDLIASVKADQPTENQARTQSSSLGLLLAGAVRYAGGDDQAFLQKATVTSEGKNFVLNFTIPRPQVQEMIMRKLAEVKAEPKQSNQQRNGTAAVRSKNNAG